MTQKTNVKHLKEATYFQKRVGTVLTDNIPSFTPTYSDITISIRLSGGAYCKTVLLTGVNNPNSATLAEGKQEIAPGTYKFAAGGGSYIINDGAIFITIYYYV